MTAEPDYDDLLAPIRSTVVKYFTFLAGAAVLILALTGPLRGEPLIIMASYAGLLVLFGIILGLHTERPLLAGALCSLGPLVLVTLMVSERGGMKNPAAITAYVTLVLVTGFVWSAAGTGVIALLSSGIIGWFILNAQDPDFGRLQQWGELTLQLLIVWGIVRLTLAALGRSQKAARRSEARFRHALESAPEAMVGLDDDGNIRVFNAAAARMSQLSAERPLGRPLSEIAWFEQRQIDVLLVGCTEGLAQSPLEVTDAHEQVYEVTFARLDEGKDGTLHLLSLRDVTERRRAEKARELLEGRVAHSRSIDALGRLAGGVAHDFNNLLTVISGSAEILRSKGRLSPEALADVERIEQAAQRAARLTAQLLAFGRKQVLEPRVLRLEQTFASLEPLLERVIPENVRFDIDVALELDAVKVDEARLEQVLVNLISNACHAMPAGGRLTLRARNVEEADVLASDSSNVGSGPRVEILVEDTGNGMDAETRERLFEPFFTTKTFGNGTGLGLATVHGIVAQSGGHIAVESQPGEGSRFFVYLPRSSEELAPPPASVPPRHGSPAAGVTILLVEDQPDVRGAAKRMLEHLGHRVETARDGQQALEIWASRANEFDLLISDVVMPGLDGPSLARRLREDRPELSVLFVSGYPESSLPLAGALTDGAAYLPKPFTLRSLSTQLAAALAVDE